jgi:hypothetical protein
MARARRKDKKCSFYATCGNMATAIVCGGYHVCSKCEKEVTDDCEKAVTDDTEEVGAAKENPPKAAAPVAVDPTWTCPWCVEVTFSKKDWEKCLLHFRNHYVAAGLLEA